MVERWSSGLSADKGPNSNLQEEQQQDEAGSLGTWSQGGLSPQIQVSYLTSLNSYSYPDLVFTSSDFGSQNQRTAGFKLQLQGDRDKFA